MNYHIHTAKTLNILPSTSGSVFQYRYWFTVPDTSDISVMLKTKIFWKSKSKNTMSLVEKASKKKTESDYYIKVILFSVKF